MPEPSPLASHLASFPSLLVAYSGGVDSALLAIVARRVLGNRSGAAIGVSASLSAAQHRQARDVAQQFDLRLFEVRTDELADDRYTNNTQARCYFCKRELWHRLKHLAEAERFGALADGTNADDLGDHRPGFRAGREQGIHSPLADVGYTKQQIRREARSLGIPVWDAPAAPCLASRIPYGVPVTHERLEQVERAEAVLRSLGLTGNLRVRHGGREARIEVGAAQHDSVRGAREAIGSQLLALGFKRVTLDVAGYRRGSQLDQGVTSVEVLAESS